MKSKIILAVLLIFTGLSFPQNDYINAEHPVYSFLKMLSVRGIVADYQDAVLPLSRKEIISYLSSAEPYLSLLTGTERELLQKYKSRFGNSGFNIVADNAASLLRYKEKKFYYYGDSLVSFTVSPLLEVSGIYSDKTDRSALLFNLGGYAYGSYSDWFGFSVRASNGRVAGDRPTAAEDIRVKRSYTFNQTRINYFDETEGHLALHSGIINLQLGRERVLWGKSYTNRLILSGNPPLFDFIRFNIAYKSLSYDFLHGWLVQRPDIQYVDSLGFDVKTKSPKYIAANRLGLKIGSSAEIGVSQVIIYSGRPVEAAYLNPFLLWESAQRSLYDLDNSFLVLDAEANLTNGLSLSGSYLFDDINFNLFDDWNNISNRSAWQIGFMMTYPVLFKDFALKIECTQVRPYTFSHYGPGEALSYTNNSYLLGYKYNPNSALVSIIAEYNLTGDIEMKLGYDFLKHGDNLKDSSGVIIKNFGGDVFKYPRYSDPDKTYLFDGILSETHMLSFTVSYECLRNYLLTFNSSLEFTDSEGVRSNSYSQYISLKLFVQ